MAAVAQLIDADKIKTMSLSLKLEITKYSVVTLFADLKLAETQENYSQILTLQYYLSEYLKRVVRWFCCIEQIKAASTCDELVYLYKL